MAFSTVSHPTLRSGARRLISCSKSARARVGVAQTVKRGEFFILNRTKKNRLHRLGIILSHVNRWTVSLLGLDSFLNIRPEGGL